MRSKDFVIVIIMCLTVLSVVNVQAQYYEPEDVSHYLGASVEELYSTFPGELWEAQDTLCSGRNVLTNGKVCFFYSYRYNDDPISDCTINRIVLNSHCGADYWVGGLPGGATLNDASSSLEDMGYKEILGTGDARSFWTDDAGHLIIVTHVQWAGACEIDYSFGGIVD